MDDTDWQLLSFDEPQKQDQKTDGKGTCPKCGRHIGKGSYIHIKSCKGHRDEACA